MTRAPPPLRDTAAMTAGLVRAAGGVIVRRGSDGRAEILVVHRPRYDDWTLPKGKAVAGESDEACALREVEEETGLACELGEEVAVSEYESSSGRPKRVRYFAMTLPEGAVAVPSNEIDAVAWLTRERATEILTYDRDLAVVARVAALAAG
jgi:8-oxo-dGTP diphosphatase